MPYFNDKSPNLNLSDEAIRRNAVLLLELYLSNPKNIFSFLDDLSALVVNSKPLQDHTNCVSSFLNLLTYTIENKIITKESQKILN